MTLCIYIMCTLAIIIGSFMAFVKDKEIRHPKIVNWTGKIIMFCGVMTLIISGLVS